MDNDRLICVYKPTHDNWFGSFYLGNPDYSDTMLVEVIFDAAVDASNKHEFWIVAANGNDDLGYVKRFDDERAAQCCFLEVIGLEFVDMQPLRDMGFMSD